MRQEAALEEWGKLYEVATRIKELRPWEQFWDMDLIGVQRGLEEDTIFFSILGRGGTCYGISVYEGFEGLNTFLMLAMREKLNLSMEYAMFNQKNLTCYWGNRDELTEKQRKTIKELGYKYRGKNQWLYFHSFEPGYYPYNLDQAEVLRMTEYLSDLEYALQSYEETNQEVQFDEGNMFLLKFEENGKQKQAFEAPLPFTTFQFQNLVITDEELLDALAETPKCGAVLEADISPLGAPVSDKKYDRPANPAMCLLGDAASEMILKYEMTKPWEDPIVILAEEVIGFIEAFGVPEEIRISNVIVEAGLEQLCEVCKIRLRRVKRLKGLDSFKQGLKQFM